MLIPSSDEFEISRISVKRLDDYKSKGEGFSRSLLQIDVQGLELPVLKGAVEALNNCA
jgi:FkbM family methyltransferase